MSVVRIAPDRRHELSFLLWGFAWLSLVGAFAGTLFNRNAIQLTEYFMVVQDTPVLFFVGMLYVAGGWLAWSRSVGGPDISFKGLDAFRFAWIAALTAGCAILAIRHFAYVDFALSLDEFMAE